MSKFLILGLFISFNAIAAGQPMKYDYPQPFWFFEAIYSDGRIVTYPVQMPEFKMGLPYNGRILRAEIPVLIEANHAVKKNLKRRFTATRGEDTLSGEVVCDLSKFKELDKVAGEFNLNFSGGDKAGTPSKIRFYCQF
jgi:hypothetical protein